jgi:mannitol/fructose-specific phosphotransferase system IIA component (Ntr-type)
MRVKRVPMTDQEFLDLFEENLFIPDLRARNKREVLQAFVDRLHREKKIYDKKIVMDMLLRRESLGSTALEDGVAVPHGRTLMSRKLILAFGRCEKGVDFDAPDGKPVHLFFLIIAPYREKKNLYLPTLGKIAEFFRKKSLRDNILKASNFQEFQDVLSREAGLK